MRARTEESLIVARDWSSVDVERGRVAYDGSHATCAAYMHTKAAVLSFRLHQIRIAEHESDSTQAQDRLISK